MNKLTYHTQRGFSLVELMVAMAVSLVLMLGIVQIFLGNKDSYRTENELATLNQNARLARFVLENAIAHAGYMVDLTSKPQHTFTDGFISDDKDTDNLTYDSDSDSITIRFQSKGDMNDCLGNAVGDSDSIRIAHFSLYIDDDNELQCTVYNTDSGKPYTEPLLNNVVLMQVLYGIDSNPDDNRPGVDQYTKTLDAGNRNEVRSVRVQLVLASESKLRTTPLEEGFDIAGYSDTFMPGQVFEPDEDSSAEFNPVPDAAYHAYVMVDQVIALRNLLP